MQHFTNKRMYFILSSLNMGWSTRSPFYIKGIQQGYDFVLSSDHPCSSSSNGCSHLCLLRPDDRYRCSCPEGLTLLEDGKTCSNHSDGNYGVRKVLPKEIIVIILFLLF